MIPQAYIGASDSGAIYLLDSGVVDGVGNPIRARAETNALAPGGSGFDHSFDRLYITLTHTMAVSIVVTPIVDGVAITAAAFTITLTTQATRTSRVFEQAILRPNLTGTWRYAPRGTWLSVRLEAAALDTGELIIDAVDFDYDVLSPRKERVA